MTKHGSAHSVIRYLTVKVIAGHMLINIWVVSSSTVTACIKMIRIVILMEILRRRYVKKASKKYKMLNFIVKPNIAWAKLHVSVIIVTSHSRASGIRKSTMQYVRVVLIKTVVKHIGTILNIAVICVIAL